MIEERVVWNPWKPFFWLGLGGLAVVPTLELWIWLGGRGLPPAATLGAFAVGELLEEAYMVSSTLEASAQILSLVRAYGEDRVREYRSGADQYDRW